MHEFWQSSPKQRLSVWRQFRKSLAEMEYTERLQAIVDFWKMAPISSMHTDIYDASTWPAPWEFVWEGRYDENNIALGMAYTLHLEGYAECEILLVQNSKKSYISLIVLVDKLHILNYNYGIVNSVDDIDVNTRIVEKTKVIELT
jgi:hypothetical protein|tara:strand:- start:1933 stop:2367 length:435 start_codon:yes stop_codon:yes gene_type:complete